MISNDLHDHIVFLKDMIKDNVREISRIEGLEDGFLDIFIAPSEEEGSTFTCEFEAKDIEFFSSIQLPLRITIDYVENNYSDRPQI